VGKEVGAHVIAAAGSDERVAAGVALGADAGVNYRQHDLAEEVKRLTGGRGVDVVFENIADPSLWPGAFDSLAYGGRLATIGAHGGGTVPLNVRKLYSLHLSVLGGAWAGREEAEHAVEGARRGAYRAVVGATLPLEEAPKAHRLAEDGAVVGKVLLVP
jgi:NADPH:quinone reductase-like Zn-dependent oxidoreductase